VVAMAQDADLQEALDEIQNLSHDPFIPKNLKARLQGIIVILRDSSEDRSIRINRALDSLSDLAESSSMPADTRTEVYNIVSMLESMNA